MGKKGSERVGEREEEERNPVVICKVDLGKDRGLVHRSSLYMQDRRSYAMVIVQHVISSNG